MEKRKFIPPTDIYENEESYVLLVEMPGVNTSSLSVKIDDDRLIIEASPIEVGKEWRAIDTEFELGEYYREFRLSPKVKRDTVEATYQDGILKITLYKAEDFKPRQIEVKTA